MGRVEDQVQDHEIRIRTLEVNNALLTDHVATIRKWSAWAIGILGATFIVQLASLLINK
jgi:hypothetical protein